MAKSKVAIAKEEQGWTKVLNKCDNCRHMDCKEETSQWTKFTYKVCVRCSIGNFATKQNCTCTCWTKKP